MSFFGPTSEWKDARDTVEHWSQEDVEHLVEKYDECLALLQAHLRKMTVWCYVFAAVIVVQSLMLLFQGM